MREERSSWGVGNEAEEVVGTLQEEEEEQGCDCLML
jgi:hypothetical protein